MLPRRLRLAPLVLAAAAWLASAPAHAKLGEGDVPPAFEGKEFINTEELSLDSLRGSLVLVEVFTPT
jgi:hypothetical protein